MQASSHTTGSTGSSTSRGSGTATPSCIEGYLDRWGRAAGGHENFSYAARFQRANDLVVIRDAAIAARFQAMFDALWAVPGPA